MTAHTKLLAPLFVGLGLASTLAFAAPVEITVQDNDSTLWGFNNNGSLSSGGVSYRGNYGVAHEDNETEGGTIAGQQWDMEAFVVNGNSLSIVAGFDLLNGVQAHNIGAGDLFIKVGGSTPGFDPTNYGAGNVTNANYGFTYAIDLSMVNKFTNASFGPTAQVYSLSSSTVLNSVIYDQFGSNPWKYDNSLNAGAGISTGITYLANQAANSAALQALGVGGLVGSYHNILTIDLSFLAGTVNPGSQVYFSYTMECGNDSLKGKYGGGFDRVPDNVASVGLIALGLLAMAIFARKRGKLA